MKNKKGIAVDELAKLGIFLVVLTLAFYLVFFVGWDKIKALNFFPNFGQGNNTVENVMLVRYGLNDLKIEYYDGVKWIELESAVQFGDKRILKDGLKNEFENYFYKTERGSDELALNRQIDLILASINFYNKGLIPKEDFDYLKKGNFFGDLILRKLISGFKNKDVAFTLGRINGDNLPFNFRLALNNSFFIEYYTSAQDVKGKIIEIKNYGAEDEVLFQIYDFMLKWRDNVFEKPMSFSVYPNEEGFVGPVIPKYYCVERRGGEYLVVDLSKEVGKDARCEVE